MRHHRRPSSRPPLRRPPGAPRPLDAYRNLKAGTDPVAVSCHLRGFRIYGSNGEPRAWYTMTTTTLSGRAQSQDMHKPSLDTARPRWKFDATTPLTSVKHVRLLTCATCRQHWSASYSASMSNTQYRASGSSSASPPRWSLVPMAEAGAARSSLAAPLAC